MENNPQKETHIVRGKNYQKTEAERNSSMQSNTHKRIKWVGTETHCVSTKTKRREAKKRWEKRVNGGLRNQKGLKEKGSGEQSR